MIRRPASAAAALSLLLLATAARAGDDPKTPPAPGAAAARDDDPVGAAWADVKASEAEINAAKQAKDALKHQTAIAARTAAFDRFVRAFATCDWNAYDPVKDEEILSRGLMGVAATILDERGDPKVAIKASRHFIDKLPADTLQARFVRGRYLPQALQRDRDLPGAMAVWQKNAEDADRELRGSALVELGDGYSAQGDLNAAQAAWSKVAEIPSSPNDAVAGLKGLASLRLSLVGKDAPEIDAKTWLGGDAKALSAHKGSVVILDFWATWSPQCRELMAPLNALALKHKDAGLVVLAVTKYSPAGFLPNEGAKDPAREGQQLPKGTITPQNFPAHLATFRERMKLAYPFVTATDVDFNAYQVQLIPTIVIVDREGRIAVLKAAPEEVLVEVAVERLLEAR